MAPALIAGGIFIGALGLILVKPRYVPAWAASLGGGLLMVVVDLLPPAAALGQIGSAWNILLLFLGLGLSSAVVDHAGVFRLAGDTAARWAQGDQRRLLTGLYLVGVLVTAVLSNDATALLLTPVAVAIATRAGVGPQPFVFACALVANAASFLLPVSNPSNLLLISRIPLTLAQFLGHLLLPAFLAITVTLLGLLVVFRRELDLPCVQSSAVHSASGRTKAVAVGVCGLGAAYILGGALNWPLGVVALTGSIALIGLDAALGGWAPRALARGVPWSILPLFVGLALLVGGAERVHLFGPVERAVQASADLGPSGSPVLVLLLALLSNCINNLPAALVTGSALGAVQPGLERTDLVSAAIIGVNLGPNLTTIGSLSTMLWLLLLRRGGIDVSILDYLRVGTVVTLPALLAAAAGLWLVVR
jgi:arsenical pump membrane protein